MTQFTNSIGIDVSKKTLDISIMGPGGKTVHAQQIKNNVTGLKGLMKKLNKILGKNWKEDTLFCLEHTGIYCRPFLEFSLSEDLKVWLQHALEIKRRGGMTRGKSDAVDAERIAEYAYRYQDKVVLWEDEGDTIRTLRTLLSSRSRLQKAKNQFEAPMKEAQAMGLKMEVEIIKRTTKATLKAINKELKSIDKEIEKLLKEQSEFAEKAKLLLSVPGIL
ncbi:MAG: transposase [Bacteroidia bacterium]|nr:transposase [Bacteroidia bacterium]